MLHWQVMAYKQGLIKPFPETITGVEWKRTSQSTCAHDTCVTGTDSATGDIGEKRGFSQGLRPTHLTWRYFPPFDRYIWRNGEFCPFSSILIMVILILTYIQDFRPSSTILADPCTHTWSFTDLDGPWSDSGTFDATWCDPSNLAAVQHTRDGSGDTCVCPLKWIEDFHRDYQRLYQSHTYPLKWSQPMRCQDFQR